MYVVLLSGVSEFREKVVSVGYGEYFKDLESDGEKDGKSFEQVKQYLVEKFDKVNKTGAWARVAFVDPGDEGVVGLVGNAVWDRMRGGERY